MSSIVTVGINLVATGFNQASDKVRQFGNVFQGVHREAETFSKKYNKIEKEILQSSNSLKSTLNHNWQNMFNDLKGRPQFVNDHKKALEQLEVAYDRTLREIGNKYQSMVMGSVALSMSGIGIKNAGMTTLQALKTPLDQARDWELVMKQIQFYGKLTNDELAKAEQHMFKMGRDLPVTTTEIGNSVMEAFKLGYDQIGDAQTMASEASKIQFMSLGKLDGSESLKYLNHFMKLSGYGVNDASKLTDKLTKTSDLSASSIDSLWKTIQSSRSAMDNLGLDADNMLTLAGVMSDRLQPRMAGMALSSFSGGVQMAEKSGREVREGLQSGSRGTSYNELLNAMGNSGLDSYNGDILKYIEDVAVKSKEIWGDGAERTGKLISMFGRSSLDLFHAYDAYSGKTGKTMEEMRKEIQNANGHSKEFMDTIMNTSYGTEMMLQAAAEQFQILFGQTIRPAFNQILKGLTAIITKINEFVSEHPKIAKFIGYFVGFGAILAVATGALMIFGGALLAIYASLNNFIIQLARNNNVVDMLANGYKNAGQMIKAQMLNPLRSLGAMMLRLTGITFFLWMAWKHDFLRMRTTFEEWHKAIGKGLERSRDMFQTYSQDSASAFIKEWKRAEREGTFESLEGKIAKFVTKAKITWEGVKDIWKDGMLSEGNTNALEAIGMDGFVKQIGQWKKNAEKFWKGFVTGFKDGIEIFMDITKPIREFFGWLRDKFIEIAQHFGYFQNVSDDLSNKWEKWGQKLGVILGIAVGIKLALWAFVGAWRAIVSPIKFVWNMLKGIWGLVNKIGGVSLFKNIGDAFKNAKGSTLKKVFVGLANGFAKSVGQAFLKFLPGPIRTLALMFARLMNPDAKKGASSKVPQAKPIIDPVTKKQKIDPKTGQPMVFYDKNQKGMKNQTVIPSKKGGSGKKVGKGFTGKLMDLLLGREYDIDKTAKNGRKYAKTDKGGTIWTDKEGKVKGKTPRTGNGLFGKIKGGASKAWKFIESVSAFKPNRISAFGSWDGKVLKGKSQDQLRKISPDVQSKMNQNKATNVKAGGMMKNLFGKFDIGSIFKQGLSKVGSLGKTVGSGLMKGLGGVVKVGLPLLFKGALRLIPIVGWAITAWQLVSAIFTNWDAIKSAGQTAWNWIKTTGVSLLGQAWTWIKTTAMNAWNNIKAWGASAWNSIKTTASSLMSALWGWIKSTASATWNAIKSWAVSAWNTIKSTAISVMNSAWSAIKTAAQNAWNWIKSTASSTWTSIKAGIASAFSNAFQSIKDAWDSAKSYVMNNPIVQTITKVTKNVVETGSKVGGAIKNTAEKIMGNFRTGLDYVPKDNYVANLHQGEMVLTRREAMLLRNGVGPHGNIAQWLLEKQQGESQSASISKPSIDVSSLQGTKAIRVNAVSSETGQSSSGDTKIEFQEGAFKVEVRNSSKEEMKRGAKEMFNEFKRLMEIDNMRNYRTARPK